MDTIRFARLGPPIVGQVYPTSDGAGGAVCLIREIAVALKVGDPAACRAAARVLARLLLPDLARAGGGLLVALPDSTGDAWANIRLAEALLSLLRPAAQRGGWTLACSDAVTRRHPVASSWRRRRAGGLGLTAAVHADSMVARPLTRPAREAAQSGVWLLDNVWTAGGTATGAAQALATVLPEAQTARRLSRALVWASATEAPAARRVA